MSQNSDNAKHAFFYLVAFFALGFTATALGQVIFQLVNQFLVETTSSYSGEYSQSVLRFAISSLVIAAPIYFVATRKINSALARNSLDAESALRKWLTYFAIFVAAAVGIGDLIFVLNSFLSGELTLKFLLKSATIFAIVGGFGGYYFTDLHRKNFSRDLKIKIFGAVFVAAVLAALVVAFSLVDSPFRARQIREDEERISELRTISYSVRDFFTENSALPENLETLVADSKILEKTTLDPVTDEKYEFEILGAKKYQLCADFALPTADEYSDPEWVHSAGRDCFELEIIENEMYSTVDVQPVRLDF